MFVNRAEVTHSRHSKIACSQCHSEVNASRVRPCETITHPSIAPPVTMKWASSISAAFTDNCREGSNAPLQGLPRHARDSGQAGSGSPPSPPTCPELCARCHREGQKAAVRYTGRQREIIANYTESIHGKGLLKSGLTVTATCTSCHTAHSVLPRTDPKSS
jgi:hypothetical protein